ncbi:hypothetical protein [Candidatus Tisiphia endosymbiont of Empis tessellata]|uniref:hypothetical protein n=1 Tax=Candidatus Tisiphia endosymbiont of Empis tessellata TaxID=3066259 RepID=UPI00313EEAF7
MGRINKYSNGNLVNQNREIQGEFLKKQDTESYSLSKKMNNGNNIQEKNTVNIDDLFNIPALDTATSQDSIKPIDGGTAHTPIAQALLPLLTLLSAAFPNTTAPPNKAIDNPNGSLSRVTSPTKVNMPVLFDTTPATTSTSQNHAPSKKLTKHSDDPSLIREKDGFIRHSADGNIILGGDGKKLTFSHHLDIKILKKQLTNSNITELCLWEVATVRQKAQKIGKILKDNSNVKVLSILYSNIGDIGTIDFGRMLIDTEVTTLNLAYNRIDDESAIGLIESLKGTKVQELNLSDNRIGDKGKGAKGLIKSLKETNVKVLDLSDNNMSDKKVNDIIPELKENTKIIELGLKDKGIKRKTFKKVLEVLEQNRHVNKEPTSTIESSTTEGESSTTEKKREKRDIHTTEKTLPDETLPKQETTVLTTDVSSTTTTESTTSATEDSTNAKEETTVPTVKKSSTTTMKVTTSSPIEDSTTAKEEPTTTVKSTVPTVEEFSTTTMEVTTSSPIEDSTAPEKKTTTPIMEKSSTTTKRVTTSSTEGSATTEQETTVPTTDGSSTTTTKSTASSAGNPTTLKEELTTPKKNLTEKSEPIAVGVVVDSITEKHIPEELNPNNPASSTMSTKEILALISFAVTAIGVGGGVVICAIKKFWGGVSHLGHEALALADLALVELDNRLDNNEETSSLTGITVNDDMD